MKVILLKDVNNVGRKSEVKSVKDGFAINFLIPKKLAVLATDTSIKQAEANFFKSEAERKIHEDLLKKNLASLNGSKITMKEKSNEQGHLFAGVQADEVVKAIKDQTGLDIDPKHLNIDHALKALGEYEVGVSAHGFDSKFTLAIEAL